MADSHLGFDYPIRPRIERKRRGPEFFDNFRRVLDYAVSSKPDMVVHGGDLFFRSRIPPKVIDMAYAELLSFSMHDIPLFLLPGNHERSSLPTSLWLSRPNVHIFDQPATFNISVRGHEVAICGFPFCRENVRQRFASLLEQTGWRKIGNEIKLLCLHQAIEGATVGPADYTFQGGTDIVKMADIPPDFVAVLAGHIHRRQILRNGEGGRGQPIVYPGSIERTSLAEKDEPKGF